MKRLKVETTGKSIFASTFVIIVVLIAFPLIWGEVNGHYVEEVMVDLEQNELLKSENVTIDEIWDLLDEEPYRRLDCNHLVSNSNNSRHWISCYSPLFIRWEAYGNGSEGLINYLTSWAKYKIRFKFEGEKYDGFSTSVHWQWTI